LLFNRQVLDPNLHPSTVGAGGRGPAEGPPSRWLARWRRRGKEPA